MTTLKPATCPKCGSTYTDRPARSRWDDEWICPVCGQREALVDFHTADWEVVLRFPVILLRTVGSLFAVQEPEALRAVHAALPPQGQRMLPDGPGGLDTTDPDAVYAVFGQAPASWLHLFFATLVETEPAALRRVLFDILVLRDRLAELEAEGAL